MLNLHEALNKSNTNTHNMLTILQSFENRLMKLESTVEPVYNETEMLRRRQESILTKFDHSFKVENLLTRSTCFEKGSLLKG